MNRTLAQIASMSGGTLAESDGADTKITGIYTDSRNPLKGGLFVPIAGERFDGHAFADNCIAEGAGAFFWQEDHGAPPAGPAILVRDTLKALQQLAAAYLKETRAYVVGITGSNGKTTTKDIVAALLSTTFRVHKTQGNYNNHIGLPLTVLSMPEETQIAILEMGMSGREEIRLLSRIAQPDVAVITNIGEAHLLQLGSREEIARAKLEIISGLKPGGLLICNGDEPLLPSVLAEPETERPEEMKIFTFGLLQDNDDYPTEMTTHDKGIIFTTKKSGAEAFDLPLLGRHNVVNCLAAMAVARQLGVGMEQMRQGLAGLKLTGMRIEMILCDNGLTLLNDTYNASPLSMKAAIDTLGGYSPKNRKIAVLGDMLELGAGEEQYHREIGRYAAAAGVDLLFTYGPLGSHIAEGAREQMAQGSVHAFSDKDELVTALREELCSGDVVLLKASRGMKLETVVDALKEANPLQNG
ncbi:UDP-N-acetylmuramoyl-tripeptide--D-alanyl-D-alanine ligase [Paenibacillus zeirhizosphaerae]|uniref:UDP-N-acetylmuramoyl-tripeptide--D-alanyl-D- alanine ligase n=1 Tax=Paenibacillus zeirhizosphaerae TaxID=2987519 RepID=UPI002737B88E|nr:UDP-N-acetylmuramoyl-tripeptide--D-alanyl-D-alanine ligase [Paenibacillus sp. P96]